MNSITVTLTAYNMGPDATEEDFDSFAAFVSDRIDDRTGLDVTVDQFRFAGSGQGRDAVSGANEEQERSIRETLAALWDEWCAQPVAMA